MVRIPTPPPTTGQVPESGLAGPGRDYEVEQCGDYQQHGQLRLVVSLVCV